MKIEIWSDFVCPFCYIGKRHLESAMNGRKDIEIEFKSFELSPFSGTELPDKSVQQTLAERYGISLEEAALNTQRVSASAKQAGLHFDFDKVKMTNTFKAHRLAHFAKTKGKGNELVEAFMHAVFSDGAFLNDDLVLTELATSVGLDKEEVLAILHSNQFEDDVLNDEKKAKELEISGVPFFLINGKYALSGAQPIETFKEALAQIDAENKPKEKPINLNSDAEDLQCDDENCIIH